MRLDIVVPDWAERLASDLTDMDRASVAVEGGEVVSYDLPDDVYFEYAFADDSGTLVPDPAVAERAMTIWYGEVSAVRGAGYRRAELAEPPADQILGATDRLRLQSAAMGGQTRRVSVYTPAGVPEEPLPLVVVQDGVAAYRTGKVHQVAQALFDRGEMRPARFAFLEPVDRLVEYAFDDTYQDFMHDELLPHLRDSYALNTDVVWLGFSLGGLASARAARRATARDEGRNVVVAFSGAFKGAPEDPDPYRSERSWLLEALREPGVDLPEDWYLEVGTLEWLHDVNEQAARLLADRGATVVLRERSAGHNWTSWRNGIPDALRFALGR
ncbi:MAG TPA: alpha/beta hydrolase-fold protein [Trueperaceae bacterium]|nr:alpha/beta hydrolase-fold protein [Trueperaceae bacterium]